MACTYMYIYTMYMYMYVVIACRFLCGYHRDVEPRYGFMILNRLNSDNMLEEVAPGMEFRVQNPFVLFKKRSGEQQVVN